MAAAWPGTLAAAKTDPTLQAWLLDPWAGLPADFHPDIAGQILPAIGAGHQFAPVDLFRTDPTAYIRQALNATGATPQQIEQHLAGTPGIDPAMVDRAMGWAPGTAAQYQSQYGGNAPAQAAPGSPGLPSAAGASSGDVMNWLSGSGVNLQNALGAAGSSGLSAGDIGSLLQRQGVTAPQISGLLQGLGVSPGQAVQQLGARGITPQQIIAAVQGYGVTDPSQVDRALGLTPGTAAQFQQQYAPQTAGTTYQTGAQASNTINQAIGRATPAPPPASSQPWWLTGQAPTR
jgi:hypothetical protein